MTRLIAALCLVALAGAGAASAETRRVDAVSNSWLPRSLNVLVGDSVLWKNRSIQNHDLKIGAYDELLTPNEEWLHPEPFDTPGLVNFVCTIHFSMTGSIAVHHAYMTGPVATVLYGSPIRFNGLAPAGEEVAIQRDVSGTWTTVGSATAAAGDSFTASITPAVPGRYRAQVTTGESPVVTVKVKPRVSIAKQRIPRKRFRITVGSNVPTQAGAPVVLQRRTAAGWRALASMKLNVNRKATFVVAPKKGTWRLRAQVKPFGGYALGQSGVIAVKR